MKVRQWLVIGLVMSPFAAAAQFCSTNIEPLNEQQQDSQFVAAMFEADYVFRGRLFSFYGDLCQGEICTWTSLVFKRLEDIKGNSNPYVEGDWVEQCSKLWLHSMAWRFDPLQQQFSINSEYLILAQHSDNGLKFIGSRNGLKVNQLMMQYQMAVIGGLD